jgi:cell fate regulator YaaT (PSP1 superfamily)
MSHISDGSGESHPDDSAQKSTDTEVATSQAYWVIRVLNTREIVFAKQDSEIDLAPGVNVIVPTKFGSDLAKVIGTTDDCGGCRAVGTGGTGGKEEIDLVVPEAIAVDQDLAEYRVNLDKAREAFGISQDLINQHGLSMKLVKIHFVLRESRIVFFFTSEKRVDFRSLVRDLVSHFRARIELRQIGVRDEARMVGGRGVCGRELCCSAVSHELEPVSIKMAKVQKLSLNSQKISGPCGRLLCCLAFEHQTYQSEQRGLPREGQWVLEGEGRMKIFEVNILNKKVYASDREGQRKVFSAEALRYSNQKNAWEPVPVQITT